MREFLKALARTIGFLFALPFLASYLVKKLFLEHNKAFEGSTQAISLIPGMPGEYVRRAFLSVTLRHCDPTSTVEFGTIFSQTGASIDANVYVGPRCHLGLVHLEKNVLLAAGVHIPSGAETHGTADTSVPIRDQPGARVLVRIGEGSWIGSASVVLADVGKHCVVGAGAVVTKPLPDYSIAVGVPAKIVRSRLPDQNA